MIVRRVATMSAAKCYAKSLKKNEDKSVGSDRSNTEPRIMSRIGKKPVAIASGVKVNLDGRNIAVEGPKGKLSYEHRPEVSVEVGDDNQLWSLERTTTVRRERITV